MEGPVFRKLTPAELDRRLPTLQVLARSSPSDKHMLVCRLNGHSLPTTEEEWLIDHPGEGTSHVRIILTFLTDYFLRFRDYERLITTWLRS
jgi:hypothetical protein